MNWGYLENQTRILIAQELMNANIITTPTVDQALFLNLTRIFLPHGLGHHVGVDVHDGWSRPTVKLFFLSFYIYWLLAH